MNKRYFKTYKKSHVFEIDKVREVFIKEKVLNIRKLAFEISKEHYDIDFLENISNKHFLYKINPEIETLICKIFVSKKIKDFNFFVNLYFLIGEEKNNHISFDFIIDYSFSFPDGDIAIFDFKTRALDELKSEFLKAKFEVKKNYMTESLIRQVNNALDLWIDSESEILENKALEVYRNLRNC